MIKYELTENTIEIKYKDRHKIEHGCSLDGINQYPEILGSFDNEKDACEYLKNYRSSIRTLGGHGSTYYDVTEYYVEEVEYDDEDPDEFVNDFGTCAFAEWNEPSQELINSWK